MTEEGKTCKTADKDEEEFRVYDAATQPRVYEHVSVLYVLACPPPETSSLAVLSCAEFRRRFLQYKMMRENHTVAFYDKMEAKYSFAKGGRRRMTIKQAFVELEDYIDASDPDLSLPNLIHLLQTAEGIRKDGHPDWFQLVGLLHDMGKIMFLWGTGEDGQDGLSPTGQQWALGGDTFVRASAICLWSCGLLLPNFFRSPNRALCIRALCFSVCQVVGCAIPDCVVFPELNGLNPDMQNEKLNTPSGMYEPGCGLDALKFAWGHDEYMWRMLTANGCTIPKEGLDMIRYHSAYPMHDKGAYKELLRAEDEPRLEWIRCFNQYGRCHLSTPPPSPIQPYDDLLATRSPSFAPGPRSPVSCSACVLHPHDSSDLYTKDEENVLEPDKLWPYYESLLEKYGLSGELMW